MTPDPVSRSIETRKLRHLEACLLPESQYQRVKTGLDAVPWPYRALPESNLDEVRLDTVFLGHRLKAPVLIGAMTGGAERARHINRNLARAARNLGLGMMLGSQRVMLEHPDAWESFNVREVAPDILLIGNLGAAQFMLGYGAPEARRAVEEVMADALAIHLNPLQEAMQRGGDTRWQGVTYRLKQVARELDFPVIIKEVGHGLDAQTLRALGDGPFAAYDVAGAGGTSWARVEQLVTHGRVLAPDLCELGVPTAQALRQARETLPDAQLIASGGIRSGLDAARALALGAEVVAVARPLLEPALDSSEAAEAWLRNFIQELRVALFVGGYRDVREVRGG